MISYRDFDKILEQLSKQVWEKIQTHPKFNDALSSSIQAWCKTFEIPKEESRHIFQWTKSYEIKALVDETWKEWSSQEEHEWWDVFKKHKKYSKFYQFLRQNLFERINMNITQIKFIVLIAFVLTTIGYSLYLLNQKLNQNQSSKDEEPIVSSPVQPQIPQTLILVINALKAEITETITRQDKITPDDCEPIYRATESLWIGYRNKLSPQIVNCFLPYNEFVVSEGEESEYDVYLVQIELKDTDKGFNQDANQLARIDAFRQLADLSANVKVSPRLRVNAYENTEVYLKVRGG